MYKFNILNFKLIYDSQFEKLTIRNKNNKQVYTCQTKKGKILEDLVVKFVLFYNGLDAYINNGVSPISDFKIRLFKFKNNTFHIYCERPGLIIGKGGKDIDNLSNYLQIKIAIHECSLFYPVTNLY